MQTHLKKFNQLNSHNIVRFSLQQKNKEAYNVHLDNLYFTLDTHIDFPFSFMHDDYDYGNPFLRGLVVVMTLFSFTKRRPQEMKSNYGILQLEGK